MKSVQQILRYKIYEVCIFTDSKMLLDHRHIHESLCAVHQTGIANGCVLIHCVLCANGAGLFSQDSDLFEVVMLLTWCRKPKEEPAKMMFTCKNVLIYPAWCCSHVNILFVAPFSMKNYACALLLLWSLLLNSMLLLFKMLMVCHQIDFILQLDF